MERLAAEMAPHTKLVVSTGNVAFAVPRTLLLAGQFNYGKRGILDLTHTRLFTFGSFRRLFEQGGFRVVGTRGIPGPFPLALRNRALSRFVMTVNNWLIRVSRGLFSYQIFYVVEPLPSLEYLLAKAHEQSASTSGAEERRIAGSRR